MSDSDWIAMVGDVPELQTGTNLDDPEYQCEDYREKLPDWRYLDMVYRGGWQKRSPSGVLMQTADALKYFPKEQAEDQQSWLIRYQDTPYEDRYRQTIRKFVALLWGGGRKILNAPAKIWADKLLVDPLTYQAINPYWDNIDGKGTNGDQFVKAIAYKAMALGIAFVFVEWSGSFVPNNLLESIKLGFRPYWVHVEPFDLPNWKTQFINGAEVLTHCTIKTEITYNEKDATYKTKEGCDYRTYSLDDGQLGFGVYWAKYEKLEKNQPIGQPVETGFIDLPYIPLVPIYAGEPEEWGMCDAPLKAIADLCLKFYRMSGDLYRYLKLCCLPVPVVSGGDTGKPIVLSPSVPLHVDSDGALMWAEPAGSSLNQLRVELNIISANMEATESNWMRNPADNQTAFLSAVQATATDSGLEIFAEQLMAGVNRLLKITCDYIREPGVAQFVINAGIGRKLANDAAKMAQLIELKDQRLITLPTFLRLLKETGFLPDWVDPAFEAQQIAASSPPWSVPIDGNALKDLMTMALQDFMTKEEFLTECSLRGWLSPAFNIKASLKETGEDIELTEVGNSNRLEPYSESDESLNEGIESNAASNSDDKGTKEANDDDGKDSTDN